MPASQDILGGSHSLLWRPKKKRSQNRKLTIGSYLLGSLWKGVCFKSVKVLKQEQEGTPVNRIYYQPLWILESYVITASSLWGKMVFSWKLNHVRPQKFYFSHSLSYEGMWEWSPVWTENVYLIFVLSLIFMLIPSLCELLNCVQKQIHFQAWDW